MAYSPPAVNEFWHIAFAEETTYKTAIAIASVTKWIGILDEDQTLPQAQPEYTQYYGGGNAKPITTVQGKTLYDGKIKWKVQNGQLFKQMMGKVVDAGVGPYTHTYSTGTAAERPLPSITLAYWFDRNGNGIVDSTDICGLASGVKLGKFTLSFDQGQALMCEADIKAVLVAKQSTFPAQSVITTKPYMMKHVGSITVGGVTTARIMSGSIGVDQALKDFEYGQETPYEHVEGKIVFDASFTLVIENDSLWTLALADPTVAMTVSLTFTRGTNDTLAITLTNAYPALEVKKGAENVVEGDVKFTYEDISIVITDSNATYPI